VSTRSTTTPGHAGSPSLSGRPPGTSPQSGEGGLLSRAISEFRNANGSNLAAALTYYALLSLFPALIAIVGLLGLVGHGATGPLLEAVPKVATGPAAELISRAIRGAQHSRGGGAIAFALGLATALWAASGYVSGFMWASNRIYDVEEGRPVWKKLYVRLASAVMALLVIVSAFAVTVLTGSVASTVGRSVGAGSAAVSVWGIAKWPLLLAMFAAALGILYWAAPNVRHGGVRSVARGAGAAVIVWVFASALFALFVANFGSYNKTYGSLAGVIVFIVWLWITNIAVVFGAQLNAVCERARERGGPPLEDRRKADGSER